MIKIIYESEEINKKNCPNGYEFVNNGVDTAYVKYCGGVSLCITYDGYNYVVSYSIKDVYKSNRHNYYRSGEPMNVESERKFKSLNDATKFVHEMCKYYNKEYHKDDLTPEEQEEFDKSEREWYYNMKNMDDAYDY